MPRDPESILVLRLGGIGEVLAITPALRAVRSRFRRAWITLLAEDPACQAAAGLVDEVLRADAPYRAVRLASLWSARLYAEAAGLVERLLRRKYDLFLDFHHLFARRHAVKPFLVSLLSRAPRRIGFGRAFFLTDPVADPDDRPMVERNRLILAPLGIEIANVRPTLAVPSADQEWMDSLLAAMNPLGERLLAIAPGSSRPVTRWGAERFGEVARRLAPYGRIVLVGSEGERGLCESVLPHAWNMAGRTTFGRLAALLGRSSLLISNDSGPLHMASALGTPVVGIFRPGEVVRWGSYGDPSRFRALWRDGPGAAEGATLPLITVDEVVSAAENLLHAIPPRP